MGPNHIYFKFLYRNTAILLGPTLLFIALILWSAPAMAAGFFLPTRGVEASARGGASVAPHRADLNALWFNPAGLSLLDGMQLSVDLAVVGVNATHQRAPREMNDGSTRTYEAVQNEAPPNAIPQILIGGPTPIKNLTWAAGAYTPYSGSARYPEDGPQRYVLIDNVGSALGYLHAAVAWQINDRLSIGAGFQNFMGSFYVVTKASGYPGMFGDPEDEDLDLLAVTTITSFFSPTGNLGATYRLGDRIQTGLSVQLPSLFRDRQATIDTRMPDHPSYDNAETTGNEVDIAVPFPFFVRGGVRYIGDGFDVELAAVYQHWSIVDEVVITPNDVEITNVPGIGNMEVSSFVFPHNYRNTFSLHLGGEVDLSESVDLRGGYVFERGAVPDTQYSVYALDPDKHQLTIGASYGFQNLTVDLTAGAIIMPSKRITNSQVRQVNPSDEEGELSLVVGNGTYDHFGYLGGVGVRYAF